MALRNRTGRRRAKGQSLPLIGLMIVVLVGMVGLSVDVGNTFNQERQTTSAVNAASLAAMNTVIRRTTSASNQDVYNSIVSSLNANGVEVAADGIATGSKRRIEAYYMDAQGKPVGAITADGSVIPANVAYVQVLISGNVDTYFARVVGRNELPIKASGYAGQCAMGDGVFPLGVDKALLDGTDFLQTLDVNPADTMPDDGWRRIQSGAFIGKTARHVYVHDGSSQPGSFGFLRWKESAISAQDLEASLLGTGNLSSGFNEAPEPLLGNNPQVDPNYPTQPGTLNEGDWVYGTPGWKQGGQDPLDQLIASKTKMTLAIYDQAVSQGSNTSFHVVEFGTFVMLGQGSDNGKKYFDLAYLGSAYRLMTACSTSPVPPNENDCCELLGSVSVLPEYQIIPTTVQPIQYVVVLDQSGSMGSNFSGGGASTANPSRLSTAKQALTTLINLTNMPGSPTALPNSPSDVMALIGFSDTIVTHNFSNGSRFTNSTSELITEVNSRGTMNTTNGALGLYNAYLTLDSAPTEVEYPVGSGVMYKYKPMVLFITDGVSNQFFHTSKTTSSVDSSDTSTYASGNACKSNGDILNNAPCQTSAVGGVFTTTIRINNVNTTVGLQRPITQAINVSQDYLKARGYQVFVIALSSMDATGLKTDVPSFPHYFRQVAALVKYPDGTTNLDTVVKDINGIVQSGRCQNGVDTATTNTMLAGQLPQPVQLDSGATLAYPKVGKVTVTNSSTGYSASEYITADTSGKLSYRFAHVPPGIYSLTAELYYKHPKEPAGVGIRVYTMFSDTQSSNRVGALTVELANSASLRPGSLTPSIQRNLDMRLGADPCAGV
ncbi:MAG: VWA domain-containing protein [Chloroflexales bacterium]